MVDAAEGRSAEQLLAELVRVLPVLYEAALRLPYPVVETAEPPETRLTHDEWKKVFDRLWAVLAADDLADDLADIYRDVKEGLDLAAAGASDNEVLWQWQFNFWAHWGQHAVDALRIIHARLAA